MPGPGSSEIGVVVVGVHGYGRTHLDAALRLAEGPAAGGADVVLAGLCDPLGVDGLPGPLRARVRGTPVAPRLEPLLAGYPGRTVTVVATPIASHVPLTVTALEHGSSVLLEKPPAASAAGFRRLLRARREHGGAVQVGFQDLGSAALGEVRALLAGGAVGALLGIGVAGSWSRDSSYYGRARWAGRRRLDGEDVVDGVLTNPFAHAVAAALRIDGSTDLDDVVSVEAELFHANPVEADDTSCVRVRTAAGTTIVVAATLCAEVIADPVVVVHGGAGRIEWQYKAGRVTVTRTAEHADDHARATVTVAPPVRLLANLVDHVRDPAVPLLVPLEDTGAFTAVLEAIRVGPEPRAVPADHVVTTTLPAADGGPPLTRRTVPGIERVVREAAETLQTFSELGVPWARR